MINKKTNEIKLFNSLNEIVKSIYKVNINKNNTHTHDILMYLREMGLNALLHTANFIGAKNSTESSNEALRILKLLDDIKKYLAFIHSSRLSNCKTLIKKINPVISLISGINNQTHSGDNYGNV